MGLKLDSAIYTGGTAVPGFRGMETITGTQTGGTLISGGPAVGYGPILDAVGALRAENAPEPYAFAAPPAVFTALSKKPNGTLTEQEPAPREMPATFSSTQLSTNSFVYSPSECYVVRRQDVAVELDRSRLFNSDQSELRGKLRASFVVPNPKAIVKLVTGS